MTLIRHARLTPDWRPERLRRLFDFDFDAMTEPFKVEEMMEDGNMVIRAEVPGIDPDTDVEITISEGVLHFDVHRTEKTEHKDKAGYRSEFHYGEMKRAIALPVGVTEEDVVATYKDGILEVKLPIAEAVKVPVTRVAVSRK
jgi:HSP20 family protein